MSQHILASTSGLIYTYLSRNQYDSESENELWQQIILKKGLGILETIKVHRLYSEH